jgi:hypothetical protein
VAFNWGEVWVVEIKSYLSSSFSLSSTYFWGLSEEIYSLLNLDKTFNFCLVSSWFKSICC